MPQVRARALRLRIVLLALAILGSRTLSAQTLFAGTAGIHDGILTLTGETTVIQIGTANVNGDAATAVFGWSASPCPAAVKIKFFRPVILSGSLIHLDYLAERGPFSVTQPVQTADPSRPPVTQAVVLSPPVSLHAGDIMGITNLTSCGAPTFTRAVKFTPPAPSQEDFQRAVLAPGDVTAAIAAPELFPESEAIFLYASGEGAVLPLLNHRFRASLRATDPRTGSIAFGAPNSLGNGAGYFSLPDFTGDPSFPEVMIKMVDATSAPALGADFWFFHAPLTDVQYTITVTDQTNLAVRTFSNTAGTPGQLCGGVDTSAFPGP